MIEFSADSQMEDMGSGGEKQIWHWIFTSCDEF